MLDRYWWGTVDRVSPEAPVPVVSLERSTLVAGGAANVAANIAGLGATPYLVGITGDDEEALLFREVLENAGIKRNQFFPIHGRKTTVKTRIIAHNQQIARLDQETRDELNAETSAILAEKIGSLLSEADILVLSDYAKGFLTPIIVQRLISQANEMGKPVLADPKGKDYSKFSGATMLTPNQREAADACGFDLADEKSIERSGRQLMSSLSLEALLITQGEKGMTLFQNGKDSEYISATERAFLMSPEPATQLSLQWLLHLAAGWNFEMRPKRQIWRRDWW